MSRWFRHYAGMMRDEKLVSAAVRSKQTVERVVWVWGAILENASEVNEGGRFDFDAAEAAYFLRADESDIQNILSALVSLGRISEGSVVRWSDRQFESDKSKDRQKRYRDRIKASRDGDVTSRDEKVTLQETETYTDTKKDSLSGLAPDEAATKGKMKRPYSEAFDAFWISYPRNPNMSKAEAFKEWKKLDDAGRSMCTAAVPAYAAYLKAKPDLDTVHACRFISQRRFEGYAETQVAAKVDIPAWEKRLNYARRERRWRTSEWGPMPGLTGSVIPKELIIEGDGKGWSEWERTA